ncbi:MAG TPA: MATE family efflux transporter [Myxococcota bacterium]|nr:MATE family efflux transporter [Myxococcota bacterium]
MSELRRERLHPVPVDSLDQPELGSDLVDVYEEGAGPPAPSPQTLGVFELAWPTILAFGTQTLVRVVSLAMVASLGESAVAGVGVANQFFWLAQALGTVAPTGIIALLSRAVGAGDAKLADAALRQGLWLSLFVSVASSLALLPLTRLAIAAYGVTDAVAALGSEYLFWATLGILPLSVSLVFGAALRAAGDTRTPLAIGAGANVLNLALGWALIYGKAGFPALGVAGAGIAATLAVSLQLPVYFWLWWSGRLRVSRAGAGARPERAMMRRLLRVGWPAAFEGGLFQVGLLLFMRIAAPYGTEALAAYQVGTQILSFSFLPGLGFGAAASTLVGQHLGEGDPARAERSGWRSMIGAISVMSATGVLVIAFAPQLAAVFKLSPLAVERTVDFVWILGAVQPLMAIEYTIGGALRGAGDTRFPLLAIFSGLFLFRLMPAAIAAGVFHAPLNWVWSALILDYAVKATLLVTRFARGRWKTLSV